MSLLHARAGRQPNATAFRYKARGLWHSVSWRAFEGRVSHLAVGLQQRGIGPGMTVAVASDVSPAWLFALLGVNGTGARVLSLYQGIGIDETRHVLTAHRVHALIADGLDWLAVMADHDVPLPEQVLLTTGGSPPEWNGRGVTSLNDVERSEAERGDTVARDWEDLRRLRTGDEPGLLFCTAGTTGKPTVVAHTPRSLTAMAQALISAARPSAPLGARDTAVVELPSGHVGAVLLGVVLPMLCGVVAHVPEQVVAEAVAEVRPTFSLSLGRPWEHRSSIVRVAAQETGGFKGLVFRAAQAVRRRAHAADTSKRRRSPLVALGSALAYALVFLPLLRKLGLERLRAAFVIGPIARDLVTQWRVWGVHLREVYGTTEAGILVASLAEGGRLQPADGVELVLDTSGQLLAKSAANCSGSWEDESVRTAASSGGWLPTHDAGRQEGDHVLLIGRVADLADQPDGGRVSLTRIDAALRASPYIRSAATVPAATGGGLVALLDVDFESVAKWANWTGISFRTPAALRESEDVLRMIDQEVTAVNAHLVSSGLPRITAVSLSPTPFAVGRELAPTWSVRRDRLSLPATARPIAAGTVDG